MPAHLQQPAGAEPGDSGPPQDSQDKQVSKQYPIQLIVSWWPGGTNLDIKSLEAGYNLDRPDPHSGKSGGSVSLVGCVKYGAGRYVQYLFLVFSSKSFNVLYVETSVPDPGSGIRYFFDPRIRDRDGKIRFRYLR